MIADRVGSAPGRVAKPGGLRRYDHLTDRPQREAGKFQVRPSERDSHDRHGKHDGGDEVPESQPPAGENQPHEIAEDTERAGAAVIVPEILRAGTGATDKRADATSGTG